MYIGLTGRVEHAQETTFGTAVTCDAALPVISCDLHRVVPNTVVPRLYQSPGSFAPTEEFRTADRVEGTIVTEAFASGLGRFLEVAFRKNVSTTGSGPYVHVYALGLGSTKPSLSLNKVWYDTTAGAEKADKNEGCYIPSWTWECRTGSFAQWTFNIVGETNGGQTTPIGTGSAPVTSSLIPMYFDQAGSVAWNSVSIGLVRSMRISVDHAMPVRMGFGALTPKQPFPTGRAEVMVELEIDYDTNTFNAGLTTRTSSDLTVTFTSSSSAIYAWHIESATVQTVTNAVDQPGILTQRVTFRGFSDLTTEGVKLSITNSQASGVAG